MYINHVSLSLSLSVLTIYIYILYLLPTPYFLFTQLYFDFSLPSKHIQRSWCEEMVTVHWDHGQLHHESLVVVRGLLCSTWDHVHVWDNSSSPEIDRWIVDPCRP